jgi:RimJ/RimL family protein N-acetyltransferase
VYDSYVHSTLYTPRLEMRPMTLAIVEAVFAGERQRVEEIVGAHLPVEWPGRALVERAFSASLEAIRADPETRLWGDRLMIATIGDEPRVVGSVVFHGRPGEGGLCEIGYGVEEQSQRQGYATEGVCASVEWALAQPEVRRIEAATFGWHVPSIRVLEKAGFAKVGTRDHETLGELLVYAMSHAK